MACKNVSHVHRCIDGERKGGRFLLPSPLQTRWYCHLMDRDRFPIPSSLTAVRSYVILPGMYYGAGDSESVATLSCFYGKWYMGM